MCGGLHQNLLVSLVLSRSRIPIQLLGWDVASCLHYDACAQDGVVASWFRGVGSDKSPELGHSAWLCRQVVSITFMWGLIKRGLSFIQFHNMILIMGGHGNYRCSVTAWSISFFSLSSEAVKWAYSDKLACVSGFRKTCCVIWVLWHVISPYLTNKAECTWLVQISFLCFSLEEFLKPPLSLYPCTICYQFLSQAFQERSQCEVFVLESKIKMGKKVYIPSLMKRRNQMSVGTADFPQTFSTCLQQW